jgi:hypothetical protein
VNVSRTPFLFSKRRTEGRGAGAPRYSALFARAAHGGRAEADANVRNPTIECPEPDAMVVSDNSLGRAHPKP